LQMPKITVSFNCFRNGSQITRTPQKHVLDYVLLIKMLKVLNIEIW
jgi:hypothetical protein